MKLVPMISIFLGSVALAGLVLPGCGGPSVRDFCQQSCECTSDSACDTAEQQAGVDQCEDLYNDLRDKDIERGCGDEFDALLSCVYAADQCPTPFGLCPDEQAAYDACGE